LVVASKIDGSTFIISFHCADLIISILALLQHHIIIITVITIDQTYHRNNPTSNSTYTQQQLPAVAITSFICALLWVLQHSQPDIAY
jgi:hypothetical protein